MNPPEIPTPATPLGRHHGTISLNQKGFGFLRAVPNTPGAPVIADAFVPAIAARQFLPGDLVAYDVERTSRGMLQATSLQLMSRNSQVFLGTVRRIKQAWVLDADETLFVSLLIEDSVTQGLHVDDLEDLDPGDVVAVRTAAIAVDPDSRTLPPAASSVVPAELIRILGSRSRPRFDQDYALAKHGFSEPFPAALAVLAGIPAAALGMAGQAQVSREETLPEGCADLRNLPLVTVDGASTQDFDDAIWGTVTEKGASVVVAIADVSRFVQPGTALDAEAFHRGTSVYLPGKTVPMLPSALSNGTCSLVPGEDRFVVACALELDRDGNLLTYTFNRGLMRSAARLTYDQVFAEMQRPGSSVPSPLAGVVAGLAAVHGILAKNRELRGVLDFNDREPSLVIEADAAGHEVYQIAWEERNDAHKLVEEFMLLANQAAAKQLRVLGQGLFRHQAPPDAVRWAKVVTWGARNGIAIPAEPSLHAAAEILEAHKDSEAYGVLEQRIRGAFSSASYSQALSSHFSLGYASYAHFTSPIRRYADLVTHRILLGEHVADLDRVAAQCSERSRASQLAERYVWDHIMKAVMTRDVPRGTPMPGRVVLVMRRGIRVSLDDWKVAVFVAAEDLTARGFVFDEDAEVWRGPGRLEPGSALLVKWSGIEKRPGRLEVDAEFVQIVSATRRANTAGPVVASAASALSTTAAPVSPPVPVAAATAPPASIKRLTALARRFSRAA